MAKIYTDEKGNSFIRAFKNNKGTYYFNHAGFVYRVYVAYSYIDITIYTEQNKEQEENEMVSNIK